jgi:outer membrane protein TolC
MLKRFCLCISAASLLAGGCAVNQKKEVEQYEKVLRANLLSNENVFSPGEPLSMRQALDLANRRNEQLSIEGERYLQALIDRRRAAAGFLPTVSLVPTYTLRDKVPGGGAEAGGTGGSNAQTEAFDVPVNGSVNAFRGFSDVARLRSTAQTIEQRRNLLLDLQEAVLLDTARVYFDVLRAERSATVLESSLKVQEARVRDIQGRQQAGVARPLDVAQTEAQASSTRVSLINARNDIRNGRSTLAYLTAAPVEDSPLIDAFNAPASLPALEEIVELALENRRDLRAAVAESRAARQGVEVAVGQYYPSVTLSGNVFLYRESIPDQRVWDAVLRANLPIFSAGLIEADVREAWSLFRQAAMGEVQLRRQVRQQVLIAFEDLTSTQSRLAELDVQLRAAQQALNQAEQSYNIGLATNLERVTAQDQLLSAELQMTSARFDRTLAYLSLARASGDLRHRLETTPSAVTTTAPATRPASGAAKP